MNSTKFFSFSKIALAAAFMILAAGAAQTDGLIVVSDPPHTVPGHFPFAPLAVTFHRVSVQIDGQIAVTSVDQEFSNPTDMRLEGTYVFPLPDGAHIDRFSMDVNGKNLDAELLPADAARSLYESIVRKMRDPALLEYAGRGAFKVRVFPIEPHSKKRISIRYTQLLPSDSGLVEYVYPLNTEKFSSAPLSDVSVKVTIDGVQPLRSVYCPSHEAEIKRNGERKAVVGWEAKDVRPDTDFKVVFSRTPSPMAIDVVTSRAAGQDGYFMLLASPGFTDDKVAVQPKAGRPEASGAMDGGSWPKDLCFALDTSGSMAGVKIEQAREALRQCLAGLTGGDRFAIVRFSTEAEAFSESLSSADASGRAAAERFIDGLKAAGGTDIDGALAKALALGARRPGGEAARPYYVIFLTDGLPTIGETREEPIVDRVTRARGAARIFSFGVGTDVNTHLLDRISSQTRAVSQYVLPGESIELKVSSFASKIREPVMAGLSVSFSNPSVRVSGLYPAELPDLFNGDMLVVFGRYSGSGSGTVKLSGTVGSRTREYAAEADFPAARPGNDFIPRLWAVRRVGWLLDQIRLAGESAELRDEIVSLARQYGIVTPYTAFLILEDEGRRNIPTAMRSFQELEQDQGVRDLARQKMDSVRLEAASESARSGKSAVDNAVAVQNLKGSLNTARGAGAAGLDKKAPGAAPIASAQAPLGYKDEQSRNYATQVRVVDGRAFYQNGSVWTDSTAQAQKNLKQKRLRFAGPEFFTLMAGNTQAARWLSLGNNIDIVIGDTLYAIRDE